MLPVIHFLLDLPGIRTLSNIEAGLDFLQGLFQIQRESEKHYSVPQFICQNGPRQLPSPFNHLHLYSVTTQRGFQLSTTRIKNET